MASQAIKEYNDFTGTNGYLIVDGLTDNESGGKMKVPNYSGVTDGYVLTKTTTNGSDDVVWSAPAAGGGLPDTQDIIGKPCTYSDGPQTQVQLRAVCDITAANNQITNASNVRWQVDGNGSGSSWHDL